ncbi:hypothetical protein J6590_008108 [Homalodisca vitripennis]|nr:hypothetical protein J6590_008108 [Homalodisca vitripennis]
MPFKNSWFMVSLLTSVLDQVVRPVRCSGQTLRSHGLAPVRSCFRDRETGDQGTTFFLGYSVLYLVVRSGGKILRIVQIKILSTRRISLGRIARSPRGGDDNPLRLKPEVQRRNTNFNPKKEVGDAGGKGGCYGLGV